MNKRRILLGITGIVFMTAALLKISSSFELVRYGIVPAVWESVPGLFRKGTWEGSAFLRGQRPDAAQVDVVLEFHRLSREIHALDEAMQAQAAAGGVSPRFHDRWAALRRERESLRLAAESVIQRQVAVILREEGFGSKWGLLPPPLFTLSDAYFVLVASPREKMEITRSRFLGRDLSVREEEAAEERFDSRHPEMVSLVREIGGLAAFYPATVIHQHSLRQMLQLSVHEWLHQHLFLSTPLGRKYFEGGPLHRINETVANMAGREIGNKVYIRYYARSEDESRRIEEENLRRLRSQAAGFPDETPASPSLFPGNEPTPEAGEEIPDVSGFMRRTRRLAEHLLEQGRIREAEAYMEDQRRRLVAQGHPIRKLNQAYFAFHGNYADRPETVDPLGSALAELRLKTGSPKEFLAAVANVTSLDEFLHTLEEREIFLAPQP